MYQVPLFVEALALFSALKLGICLWQSSALFWSVKKVDLKFIAAKFSGVGNVLQLSCHRCVNELQYTTLSWHQSSREVDTDATTESGSLAISTGHVRKDELKVHIIPPIQLRHKRVQ